MLSVPSSNAVKYRDGAAQYRDQYRDKNETAVLIRPCQIRTYSVGTANTAVIGNHARTIAHGRACARESIHPRVKSTAVFAVLDRKPLPRRRLRVPQWHFRRGTDLSHRGTELPPHCTASHAVAFIAPLCATGRLCSPLSRSIAPVAHLYQGDAPSHTGQQGPNGANMPVVAVPPWQDGQEMAAGTATILDRLY
jgi:hypothetical protein